MDKIRKLFTLLGLAVAATAAAQVGTYTKTDDSGATVATATIAASTSQDGKAVLTVSGHGDISQIAQSVAAYQFNATGAQNVFLSNGNNYYYNVTANDGYVSSTTYYKAVRDYTEITPADGKTIAEDDTWSSGMSYSWKSDRINDFWKADLQPMQDDNTKWTLGSKQHVTALENPEFNNKYVIVSDETNGNVKETVTEDGQTTVTWYRLLTDAELKSDYVNVGFYTKQELYYSTDNGTTYTNVTAWNTCPYSTSYKYYTAGQPRYEAYADGDNTVREQLSADGYLAEVYSTKTFSEILAAAVGAGQYETITMERDEDGSTLTITPALTQAVLHSGNSANTSLKLLDLTRTTLTTADKAFAPLNEWSQPITNTTLETLRLPETITTWPTAPATAGDNEYKSVDLSALSALKYLNIKATNMTDAQVQLVKKADATKYNVMDKDGLSYSQLATRYGSKACDVFSRQVTEDGAPTEMEVFLNNFDNIQLGRYASGYDNLVIVSPQGSVGTADNMKTVMKALNSVTGVTNVSLSKNMGYSQTAYDLTDLTNTGIKRILLPDISSETTGAVTSYLRGITNAAHQPILQAYNQTNRHETIYTPAGGKLAAIQDKHYFNPDIDNAYWQHYIGEFNAADVLFLNGIRNSRLDLADVTYSDATTTGRNALLALDNDSVEYIAFPDLGGAPEDPQYTPVFQNCSSLKAAGQFISTGGLNLLNVRTTGEGEVAELVDMLQIKIKASGTSQGNANIKRIKFSGPLNARDLLQNNDNGVVASDGHIHYSEAVDEWSDTQTRTPVQVAGDDTPLLKTGTLAGAQTLESIDLEDATFSNNDDLTLSAYGLLSNAFTELSLPRALTEVPADMLTGVSSLNSLCLPGTIETIHARAFNGVNLIHVWTTGDDETQAYDRGVTFQAHTITTDADGKTTTTDGEKVTLMHGTDHVTNKIETSNTNTNLYVDGADQIPAGNGTTVVYGSMVLPPALKMIGTAAFSGCNNLYDVYAMGTTAPQCNVNAFSTKAYLSNNTCDASKVIAETGEITRAAYGKYADGYYFTTVLHFPKECDETNAKRYTDITREYSIASNLTDGNGKVRYLPTQAEWNRAWGQGTTGYLWDAFSKTRNGLYGSSQAFLQKQNSSEICQVLYGTGDPQAKYQTAGNAMYADNGSPTSTDVVFYDTSIPETTIDGTTYGPATALAYNTTTYDRDYRGWHQFVLSSYSSTAKEEEIVTDFSGLKDNDWWTICQHFPMTAAELKQVFGEDVKLVKLVSVTRDIAAKTITLNFGHNLVADGNDTDGYCLKAGVPYMIKPAYEGEPDEKTLVYAKSNKNVDIERFGDKSATEKQNMLLAGMYSVPAYIENNPAEGADGHETVLAEQQNGHSVSSTLKYTMIGTFYKFYLPRYCYFLGWNKKKQCVSFFWKSSDANWQNPEQNTWGAYTCVIVPNFNHKDQTATEDGRKAAFYEPTGFATAHWNYTDVSGHQSDIGQCDDIFGMAANNAKPGVPRFFYEDAETGTTAMERVHGMAGNSTEAPVFNINGQRMDATALPAGVYISNGRKFIKK